MGGLTTLTDSTLAWLKQPFDSEGDALQWGLFVGLLIVLVIIWTQILKVFTEVV